MTRNEIRMGELHTLMEREYCLFTEAQDAGLVEATRKYWRDYLAYLVELNQIVEIEEPVLEAIKRRGNN